MRRLLAPSKWLRDASPCRDYCFDCAHVPVCVCVSFRVPHFMLSAVTGIVSASSLAF